VINKQFVFIPFWVENVLTRTNNSLIDVLDYLKLKSILSINDLAQLKALQSLQEIQLIKELDSNWCLFNSWRNNTQESSKTELDSVIEPLSCSKDLQSDLLNRLSEEYAPMTYDIGDRGLPRYKIVDLNRDVTAVILNPGFIDFERDKLNQFKLISDLLKSLYVYNTISEVSSHRLFGHYVHLLEDSVR
jgi:hypothetical protein